MEFVSKSLPRDKIPVKYSEVGGRCMPHINVNFDMLVNKNTFLYIIYLLIWMKYLYTVVHHNLVNSINNCLRQWNILIYYEFVTQASSSLKRDKRVYVALCINIEFLSKNSYSEVEMTDRYYSMVLKVSDQIGKFGSKLSVIDLNWAFGFQVGH